MAHGTPDWGGATPAQYITAVPDFGELAARLMSPDILDRQGNAIFINTFQNGINPTNITVSGAASYGELARDYHMGNGWAVHLCADGTAGAYARLWQSSPFPVLSKIAVEFVASFDANTDLSFVEIDIYSGVYLYQGAIRVDLTNHKIQYYNNAGAWVDLATSIYPYPLASVFHLHKLVIDIPNAKYSRFRFNDTIYAMAQALKTTNTGVPNSLVNVVYINYSKNGSVSHAYVETAIITINEP